MGFFEKIGLIESVDDNLRFSEDEVDCNYESEPEVDVNIEESTAVNIVNDIYIQNGMNDFTTSIFKAEEVKNTLPKEMVTSTKQTTVIGILSSFGIAVSALIQDAYNRKEILNAACKKINNEAISVITENEALIEEHKKEIAKLEEENATVKDNANVSSQNIAKEIDRIEELSEFLTMEVVR